MTEKGIIESRQCPGCVAGSDTDCGAYRLEEEAGGVRCGAHVLGTSLMPGSSFALGLPRGFCKAGPSDDGSGSRNKINIWLHLKDAPRPRWDDLNVPVWAIEDDGDLVVRTYAPRIDRSTVHVIEGGALSMVPNALDVSTILDEID